jgi:hypothetical protein
MEYVAKMAILVDMILVARYFVAILLLHQAQ